MDSALRSGDMRLNVDTSHAPSRSPSALGKLAQTCTEFGAS